MEKCENINNCISARPLTVEEYTQKLEKENENLKKRIGLLQRRM